MTRVRRTIGATVLVALLALIVVLAMLVPYRPTLVVGPAISPAPLSLPDALPGLRLHVFNTGANRMSSLLVGPAPPWRADPAFLIEHPSRGLIAFDLGLSHQVAEQGESAMSFPLRWLMQSRGRPGLTFDAQIRKAGFAPGNVDYVLISHLHEDHTGVAGDFEQAIFVAGPDTRERILAGSHSPFPPGVVPEWREVVFDRKSDANARFGPFDSAIDFFGDGSIYLIPGGGHSSEGMMALVNLASGPVLLTGDAVVHFDWLESDDVERIPTDPERAATVRNQVRSLRDSGTVLIIPGHDLRRLGPPRPDLVQHHPELFKASAWPIERD